MTRSEQHLDRLGYGTNTHQLDGYGFFDMLKSSGRQQAAAEPQLGCLPHPSLHLPDSSDFAREADLSDDDGFAADALIVAENAPWMIRFQLENRTGDAHSVHLRLKGLPLKTFQVAVDGQEQQSIDITTSAWTTIPISVGTAEQHMIEIYG